MHPLLYLLRLLAASTINIKLALKGIPDGLKPISKGRMAVGSHTHVWAHLHMQGRHEIWLDSLNEHFFCHCTLGS